MTLETHHRAVLIESAKLELQRAHRAALKLEAGDIRRGLQLALDALREATAAVPGDTPDAPPPERLQALAATLEQALADLQAGRLAELGNLIEAARKQLD